MTQTNSPTLQAESIRLIGQMPASSDWENTHNIYQTCDLTHDGGVRLLSSLDLSDSKYFEVYDSFFSFTKKHFFNALQQIALSSILDLDRCQLQNGISVSDSNQVARILIWNTLMELYGVLTWNDGWNGYDACAPKYDAVINADKWIVQFFLEIGNWGNNWIRPNVSASGDGEVVFGWRVGSKRLTIYIGEQSAEYVKAWGPDMINDMDDGEADLAATRQSLWNWLVS